MASPQGPAPHSSAVRVNPPDMGFDAKTFSDLSKIPTGQDAPRLSGGAVRINPPDEYIDANRLKALTTHHVTVDMEKADPELRAQHVQAIKSAKVLAAGMPAIEQYWSKIVGEHQAREAMEVLRAEADAEIAREFAASAVAQSAKRGK